MNPTFRASYRLQLHKDFTFDDAARRIPYLRDLGVSHLYLSPILESRPGSLHGYDGIDPLRISRERGGEEGFNRLVRKLRHEAPDMGLILDIVPNHLAASPGNPYWRSLLARGLDSPYAHIFDLCLAPGETLTLPVLGRPAQKALASRELRLELLDNEIVFKYYDRDFPIAPASKDRIARAALDLPQMPELSHEPELRRKLEGFFENAPIGLLEEIYDGQFYRLEDWREGSRHVNYRRFFDINDLVALRMEDPKVFEWAHSKIESLVKEHPEIHGLRVDHVDGLANPREYLARLRSICPHVWVEKILAENETLPTSWPVEGSSGYDYMNFSTRLFVDRRGSRVLHSYYSSKVDRRWKDFEDCVIKSKREVLERLFEAELMRLSRAFHEWAPAGRFSRRDLERALKELTACLGSIARTRAKKALAKPIAWSSTGLSPKPKSVLKTARPNLSRGSALCCSNQMASRIGSSVCLGNGNNSAVPLWPRASKIRRSTATIPCFRSMRSAATPTGRATA
jgi:(1->4)-alpha-D-glucan 1-alpha-D-glucosylmutase